MIQRIEIVGTGNIAYQFAQGFQKIGVRINRITGRNPSEGKKLADKFQTKYRLLKPFKADADLVIIAVSDDAISKVAAQIQADESIVVHTSGSTSIDVLLPFFDRVGVLYPLQSMTKNRLVNWTKVPLLLEAYSETIRSDLNQLAQRLSPEVRFMNSRQRGIAHLAAVMANNFTNYLALEAYSLLESHHLEGKLIQPLLEETVQRLIQTHPSENQTGPARRNDQKTIQNHLKILDSNPELKELYQLISNQITKHYHGH